LLSLILFLTLCLPSESVWALDTNDNDAYASIALVYESGTTKISGASFALYQVMEQNDKGTFEKTADFEASGVNLENIPESDWSSYALALESYVVKCKAGNDMPKLSPVREGITDENGKINWTGLDDGIYLLMGESIRIGSVVYTPTPSIVSIRKQSGRETVQEVQPKAGIERIVNPPDTVTKDTITVVKIWEDNGHEEARPASINVILYQDGTEYARAVLTESNSWRYSWQVPYGNFRWQVAEETVPADYTVGIEQESNRFIITNTYSEIILLDNPDNPTYSPDIPEDELLPQPSSNTPGTGTKLPQTGQLWWPVSVLAAVGLILVVLGVGIKKKESK
jgi:hypothetical protein